MMLLLINPFQRSVNMYHLSMIFTILVNINIHDRFPSLKTPLTCKVFPIVLTGRTGDRICSNDDILANDRRFFFDGV